MNKDDIVIRRALPEELGRILAMQSDVFSGEQGIPCDDIDSFLKKQPICWCAVCGDKIYGATAAWIEGGRTHWGRFVVFPAARGLHIGTKLARYSFDDLFENGTEEIIMDARDATVKIVCGMGGKTTGPTYEFYGENITPVVLKREDYVKSV